MTSEKELIALLILKYNKKGGTFYVVNSKGNKRKNRLPETK